MVHFYTEELLALASMLLKGFKNELSSFLITATGVPQGSSLAPVLFSIFLNVLSKDIQAKLRFYADETTIYASASSTAKTVEELLQRAERLVINVQKTKFMILSNYGISFSL